MGNGANHGFGTVIDGFCLELPFPGDSESCCGSVVMAVVAKYGSECEVEITSRDISPG